MSNRRYFISKKADDINYGNLLYISHSVYEGEWFSISHSHYFSEIFYIVNGEGKFGIEDTNFNVKANDVVIINPSVNHREVSHQSKHLEYYVLGIENISFDFNKKNGVTGNDNFSLTSFQSEKKETLFYLKNLLKELEEEKDHYLNKANKLYKILLTDLFRQTDYNSNKVDNKQVLQECSQIKRYIDASFVQKITLDSLAEKAHLNKYYLSHAFTDAFGISPINYLISVRLQESKDLLSATDYSIAHIAQACGFSSQSYFSQSFKKEIGITPAAYRKKYRDQLN